MALVTAVMPITESRRRFLNDAVDFFRVQTFKDCELLILDETENPVERDWPERVKYISMLPERLTVGRKRNRINELVQSPVIIHFDSDDWYHPERIQRQIEFFLQSGKQVTGYHDLLYYREEDHSFWIYRFQGQQPYAVGTSLCYYRSWWEKHQFSNKNVGEDSDFWIESRGNIESQGHLGMIVARAHSDNTYKPNFGQAPFLRASRDMFPLEFLQEVGA